MPVLSQVRSTYKTAKFSEEKIMALFKHSSLGEYIDPFMDFMYGIALTLAIFKDIADFTGLGSLPVIGTLITIFVSFIIWMVMFLTGSVVLKKWAIKFLVKRYGTLIIGSALEMIFGINFFPIQTAIVVLVFYFTLQERKAAAMEKALEENKKGYSGEAEPAYN